MYLCSKGFFKGYKEVCMFPLLSKERIYAQTGRSFFSGRIYKKLLVMITSAEWDQGFGVRGGLIFHCILFCIIFIF